MPNEFAEVVVSVAVFIGPVLAYLAADQPMSKIWQAPGSWQFRCLHHSLSFQCNRYLEKIIPPDVSGNSRAQWYSLFGVSGFSLCPA